MTKDGFVLAHRVTLSAALLTGLLSIEACQISVPTTQKETVSPLTKRASGRPDRVIAPVEGAMAIEAVLSAHQEPLQQLSLKARLSEKNFVIPVARSGDFVPDDLDEYVLSIIEQSR